MREAERAVDLWSREAVLAFDEFIETTNPAWRRKLLTDNTPGEAQGRFEYEAILDTARKRYHARLGL